MGFKVWSIGEEILASDFNQYVGSQIVATFADSSQRATQLPGPTKGQLCTLDNYPGAVYIYNGADWVEVAPYSQHGQTVVTTNGAGGATITFPTAFAAPPTTIHLTDMGGSPTVSVWYSVLEPASADHFEFLARRSDGSLFASQLTRVGWSAIGTRAAT